MPIVRKKTRVRVQSFNGGEDSTSEPGVVKTPFASLARNVSLKQLGKASQIEGNQRVGDNPDILVSRYTFDASSSVDDKSTNDGTDTSISYADAKFGKGANFNGTTSKITVAADSSIDITTIDTFSFTFWIFPVTDGELDTGRVWTKGSSFGQVQNESGSTVKLRFVVDYDGTDANVITSTTIAVDTFTKVEFAHNSDKSLDIYINGVIASYSTDTTGVGSLVDDSSDDFIIGNNSGQTQTFDGVIDDARIYNDVLSTDQRELDKIFGLSRYKVGSTIDRIYRIRDTNLERLDDDFKGYTVIDSGFTADKTTDLVQADDIFFILNGTENVHSMNTSEAITDEGQGNELSAGTDANPPRGTIASWAQNNRLFISGHLTDSLRDYVWFSDTLDPQTWDTNPTTGNFFRVQSGSGGSIKGLIPFKLNEMIIYKENSIFDLDMTGATPLTDWTLQPINEDVGCRAGRTIQDIGNDHVFLDNEAKVRLLQRTTFDKLRTAVISDPIQDILDTINIDSIESSASVFIDGKYYLAIPTGSNTENDTILIWDTNAARLIGNESAGWSVIPSGKWNASVFAKFEFGDNKTRLLFGDNRELSLLFQNVGNTFDGEAIEMRVAGPAHEFGARGVDKIFGPLTVVFESGENTTAEVFANINSAGSESLGTISLLGSAPILPINLPFNLGGSARAEKLFHVKQVGRGKTCVIEVVHNTYNVSADFREYELYAEQRIPRD